jgi:gas vesicle protein
MLVSDRVQEDLMADVTKTVKDAAYVTVGIGVLAFQKAQVGRRELTKQVETQLSGTSEHVQRLARKVEERIQPVLGQLEEAVPAQAKDLVKQARTAAKEVQGQLQGQLFGRTNGTKSSGTKKKAA